MCFSIATTDSLPRILELRAILTYSSIAA
jgi:hypothetical protein